MTGPVLSTVTRDIEGEVLILLRLVLLFTVLGRLILARSRRHAE